MSTNWMLRPWRAAQALGRIAELVSDELSFRGDLSLRERWRWWRHGFLSRSGVWYAPSDPAAGEYLSDYARYVQTYRINGANAPLLNNKLAFSYMLERARPGTVPRVFGTIRSGELDLIGDWRPVDSIERLVEQEGQVVVKPIDGSLGAGFHLIAREPGGLTINGRPASDADLEQLVRRCDADLVVEFIRQAEYSRAFFPAVTNTVRVLTIRSPDTKEVVVPAAVQRIGTRSSAPVDAWHKGGLCAAIDLTSGALGRAVAISASTDLTWVSDHPDTGVPIEGAVVPGWRAVLDGVVALAGELPFLPYLGWDVVVTDDGFRILEGNNRTDVDLFQVHEPLLRDERVRRFFRHYGVRA